MNTKKIIVLGVLSGIALILGVKVINQHKIDSFNPSNYPAEEIQKAERQCVSEFYTKETIEKVMPELCKQFGRSLENCDFTGFETLLGRDQWLVSCEREKLLKLGSI